VKKSVDVFPAVVKLAPPGSLSDITMLKTIGDTPQGTRKLDRCRAVVLQNTLLIAEDSPEGPKIVFREEIDLMVQDKKTTHILTVSGKIIAFMKDDNCGCGSRLRSWNPYGSFISSGEDPN
jgi:hypothetical protein